MTYEFEGVTYEVPEWVTYIAKDYNGSVYGYEDEPRWCNISCQYQSDGGRWTALEQSRTPGPIVKIR